MADSVVDEYLRRYLRLIRVSEGEASANVRIVTKANEKIAEIFEKTFSKNTVTRADIRALRFNVNNIINLTYSQDLMSKLSIDVDDMIQLEYEWHKKTFEKLGFGDRVLMPDQQVTVNNALNKPYQGKKFTDWFSSVGVIQAKKINQTIQAGINSGESTGSIIRAIQGLAKMPKHHVSTLTRSAIMSAMNDVKSDFFDENDELMDGKIWLSTLDVRTTPFICGPRDGLRYTNDNEPVDHSYSWESGPGRIHFNCRSTWVPEITGVSIAAPRAAVEAGDNYEQGDKYTSRGKVRKPTKKNRDDGIYEIEQYTTRTKYEGWLRRQPTDYVTDAFNGNRDLARQFKGGSSLSEVYSSEYGEPLTVAAL